MRTLYFKDRKPVHQGEAVQVDHIVDSFTVIGTPPADARGRIQARHEVIQCDGDSIIVRSLDGVSADAIYDLIGVSVSHNTRNVHCR